MTFTQWTFETTNDNAIMHEFFGKKRLGPVDVSGVMTERDLPNLSAPLGGTGTLQMQFLAAALKGHGYRTAASRRGFSTGSVRSWFNAQMVEGIGNYTFGCYCFGSQTALIGGTGQCYLLGCASVLDVRRLKLWKSSTGLDPTATLLAQSGADQWALQTTFTLELRWEASDTGIHLEVWQGMAEDFSDQALVFDYDDGSAFATTVVEGLWADSQTTSLLNVFADQTTTRAGVVA